MSIVVSPGMYRTASNVSIEITGWSRTLSLWTGVIGGAAHGLWSSEGLHVNLRGSPSIREYNLDRKVAGGTVHVAVVRIHGVATAVLGHTESELAARMGEYEIVCTPRALSWVEGTWMEQS